MMRILIMFLGLQLMVVAGVLTALSNFFFRRSIDAGGTSRAFLVIQLSMMSFVAILLNPMRVGNFTFNFEMALYGILAGIVFSLMMSSIGKALECGPAGLTIALLNASTVFPILGMVALYGKGFGFEYTLWNGAGSLIVLAGLFWAGFEKVRSQAMGRWLFFALGAFALHILFLILLQVRGVLLNFPQEQFLILSSDKAGCQWFMPIAFFTAAAIQLVVYLRKEARKPAAQEMRFGLLGGAANGLGTFFLIWSTEVATSLEQAMIFPLFAVTIVLGCNLWSRFFYKEDVHWKATAVALAGIAVGSIDWRAFL
jgi:hypothetical protein